MVNKNHSQEELAKWIGGLSGKLIGRCDVEVCYYKNGSTRLTISNDDSTYSYLIKSWCNEECVELAKKDIMTEVGLR